MEALPDRACPLCGGATEAGGIYSARGVYWLPEGKHVPILLPPGPEATLRSMVYWGLRPRPMPARRCTECRWVEARY